MRKAPGRTLTFDEEAYHPDSVAAAAHLFAGRAEVWLGKGRVTLKAQEGAGDLDALAAEFLEEVNSCELRRRIAAANRPIREYIMTQALLSAVGDRAAQAAAAAPAAGLSEDQEAEIHRLIEEAQREVDQASEKPTAAEPATEGGEGDDQPMDPQEILRRWEERRAGPADGRTR